MIARGNGEGSEPVGRVGVLVGTDVGADFGFDFRLLGVVVIGKGMEVRAVQTDAVALHGRDEWECPVIEERNV